ncbi:MAG TPA: plastocyanin/azurin family copper-binding protein [Gemmatimonadaceae bacterium]|nr:plastocyanin/azurin family copper-binding protein [Gemmatimonadaceae bacterium]
MTRSLILLSSLGTTMLALAPFAYSGTEAYWTPPKTVVVKMIDKSATEFAFEPSAVSVKAGDVVQFLQTGATPHNIEFRETPAGVDLGTQKASPYLTTPNQKYEIAIDRKFAKGTYRFTCLPHEALGMNGQLTVTAQ